MPSPALTRLRDRLTQETRAEVFFDRGRRGLYATDASLYQIEPLGVVVPRTVEDVVAAVRISAEEHVAIVPRGAATSLSGQTIGPGIVIDFSKYLNRIGIVDRDAMTVRVEPGVVLDQLNAHLRPLGLMFGPDVSTSDRATIGGMIGNNSAGARSLRYGKTVDHVRALEVVLADGTPAKLGPVSNEELAEICRGRRAGGPGPSVRFATPWTSIGKPSSNGFPTFSAASAATTSTSSSRDCRCVPRAGPRSPGSSISRS